MKKAIKKEYETTKFKSKQNASHLIQDLLKLMFRVQG